MTAPVLRRWRFKFVPYSDPNADGEWVDVGTSTIDRYTKFADVMAHFADKVPDDMAVVAVESF